MKKKQKITPPEQLIIRKPAKYTSKIEVKTEHNSKIDVVIVSVNYNDFLIITLSHNIKIFDNITVVTSSDDLLCQKICEKLGVKCIITDDMYQNGSSFNKGKAINVGINSLQNPDYILLLDADIIVSDSIDLTSISPENFYISDRWIITDYQNYVKWTLGESIDNCCQRAEANKGLGFFQLFNINHPSIDKSCPYPEFSEDASWSDLVFRDKFNVRVPIGKQVIHLGDPYLNWKGRVSNKFLNDDQFSEILNKKPTYTICSFYFNYNNDWRQKRNFIKFLEQWKSHLDNLIVGVVDYGDIDFEIPCRKITIEGDKGKRIWSKEILINKIAKEIDTDYLIFIDGDIIYENLDWLDNLETVIGDNDFVQLFETINYLGEAGEIIETHKSVASGNTDNVDLLLSKGFRPGGSWMTRTKLLKSKPLFEKMVVGGGDTIMTYGIYGQKNGWTLGKVKEGSVEVYDEAKKWILDFGKKKVGYLKTTINHLYHGDLKDRNYNERYLNLRNKFTKNKIVLYTCISGNYDTIKEVLNREENIDYICFTDQDIKSSSWEIRKIPEFLHYLEQAKKARCLKILPHLFLHEYDISIWIDGSIEVLGNLNDLISKSLKNYFSICKHPDRVCTYDEARSIILLGKDTEDVVTTQINKYKSLGYPENNGMIQSGIIIRKHNHEDCKKISTGWWSEILDGSKRDQLSFNYSIWNKPYIIDIMRPSLLVSEYFQIYTHTSKGIEKVKLRKNYDKLINYINKNEV